MDIKSFEDTEMEQFLDKYYDIESTRLILTKITPTLYPSVRSKTKRGLQKGIEDFLEKQPTPPTSIYHADLRAFCLDDSTSKRIKEELEKMAFSSNERRDYANDVCKTYRVFMYNESSDRLMSSSQR